MWPFKSKKQEAEEIWNALQGAPDPDAMTKIVKQIELGNIEEVERLTTKHINDKVREIKRNNQKPI